MLSRQIKAEERKCLAEDIRQMKNKRSLEYQQITPDPPLLVRHTDNKRQEKFTNEERLKNPHPKFFLGQVNLNTGRVAGYYYYAGTKVVFEDPPQIKI